MKRLKYRFEKAIAAATLAAALAPYAVFAQVNPESTGATLNNPANVPDIQTFIANVLKAVVEISLPILTLFIVYSGFLFVTARGNAEKIKHARENFMYVILGAILILGAWVLATLIASTATQVLGTS